MDAIASTQPVAAMLMNGLPSIMPTLYSPCEPSSCCACPRYSLCWRAPRDA